MCWIKLKPFWLGKSYHEYNSHVEKWAVPELGLESG